MMPTRCFGRIPSNQSRDSSDSDEPQSSPPPSTDEKAETETSNNNKGRDSSDSDEPQSSSLPSTDEKAETETSYNNYGRDSSDSNEPQSSLHPTTDEQAETETSNNIEGRSNSELLQQILVAEETPSRGRTAEDNTGLGQQYPQVQMARLQRVDRRNRAVIPPHQPYQIIPPIRQRGTPSNDNIQQELQRLLSRFPSDSHNEGNTHFSFIPNFEAEQEIITFPEEEGQDGFGDYL